MQKTDLLNRKFSETNNYLFLWIKIFFYFSKLSTTDQLYIFCKLSISFIRVWLYSL